MTDTLERVFAVVEDRKANPQPGSYTNRLLEAGQDEIVKKIGEEAIEVVLAASQQGDERLVAEHLSQEEHMWMKGLSPEEAERLREAIRSDACPPE